MFVGYLTSWFEVCYTDDEDRIFMNDEDINFLQNPLILRSRDFNFKTVETIEDMNDLDIMCDRLKDKNLAERLKKEACVFSVASQKSALLWIGKTEKEIDTIVKNDKKRHLKATFETKLKEMFASFTDEEIHHIINETKINLVMKS